MNTHYIAVLEDEGPNSAVGVWFPDLPGCFSGGETFQEAVSNAPEAAALWLDTLEGEPWPKARSLSELKDDPEFVGELKEFGSNFVLLAVPVHLNNKKAA